MNPQVYPQQYGQSLPTQLSSTFAGALPTTMAMLPQDHAFDYHTTVSNGSYNWSQPTRSMSSDAGEDLSTGFPTPFRTNTYPTFERRMTGQMPATSSSSVPVGIDSQQDAAHRGFHEPDSYHSMHIQHDWGGGPEAAQQGSAPGVDSYNPNWYQTHPALAK